MGPLLGSRGEGVAEGASGEANADGAAISPGEAIPSPAAIDQDGVDRVNDIDDVELAQKMYESLKLAPLSADSCSDSNSTTIPSAIASSPANIGISFIPEDDTDNPGNSNGLPMPMPNPDAERAAKKAAIYAIISDIANPKHTINAEQVSANLAYLQDALEALTQLQRQMESDQQQTQSDPQPHTLQRTQAAFSDIMTKLHHNLTTPMPAPPALARQVAMEKDLKLEFGHGERKPGPDDGCGDGVTGFLGKR